MQVQINTGHDIDGHEAFAAHIRSVVENALTRFSDHITRVEVHLSAANGHKKMARLIESTTSRLRDQRNHRTDSPPPGSNLPGQS